VVGGTQGGLFDDDEPAMGSPAGGRPATSGRRRRATPDSVEATGVAAALAAGAKVVRVLPDVRGIGNTFDYLVAPESVDLIGVGTLVDVDLAGRRIRGWVIDEGVDPPAGVDLRVLRKPRSLGPDPSVVALSEWGAWRFAGARSALLSSASAPTRIPVRPATVSAAPPARAEDAGRRLAERMGMPLDRVFVDPVTVVRLPPAEDPQPILDAAASLGPVLVIAPTARQAWAAERGLRRAGHAVADLPRGWAAARHGGRSMVGTRLAAWGPCEPLTAVVVLDEHDESHFQEHIPTWHARTVALERARAAGVPCLLISPTPSLEALAAGPVVAPPPNREQAGWPRLQVVDLRYEDPLRTGSISEPLSELIRDGARVACILNRRGRARLLACNGCNELARCASCGAAVAQSTDDLVCPACATTRPPLCLACGRTSLRPVRRGVTRLRDDLETLAGEPVAELVAGGDQTPTRVSVGTSAALHQAGPVDVVAFVEFDQELLSPRYRAAEESLGLLVLAGRLVGGRGDGRPAPADAGVATTGTRGRVNPSRVLVQTALPDHPSLVAAVAGDPGAFAAGEHARRTELGWPPLSAVALVSGEGAAEFVDALGDPGPVAVLGPLDDRWMLRAPDHASLCDLLARTPRPTGRLRIEMDPVRL
jgi:primosomal protein N' (replication factor Y) (superfamily II helicase)